VNSESLLNATLMKKLFIALTLSLCSSIVRAEVDPSSFVASHIDKFMKYEQYFNLTFGLVEGFMPEIVEHCKASITSNELMNEDQQVVYCAILNYFRISVLTGICKSLYKEEENTNDCYSKQTFYYNKIVQMNDGSPANNYGLNICEEASTINSGNENLTEPIVSELFSFMMLSEDVNKTIYDYEKYFNCAAKAKFEMLSR
jgi:hypothetical protein